MSSKSTGAVYGRTLAPFLLSLLLVGGAAADNGGFDATTWGWATLLPLVGVGAALVLGGARRPDRLALAFLGLVIAFTAWTFLSVAWSDDVTATVLEGERLLVYVAAAAAFVLLEREQVGWLLLGLVGAAILIAVWALSLRAFGGSGSYDVVSVSPAVARRLAEPLGYSNGLGAFAAIGIVLAAGLALQLRRLPLAAPLLVLVPVLYFTYSRGAWLALAAGTLAAVMAMGRLRRGPAVGIAVAAAAAVAILVVRAGGPAAAVRAFSHAPPAVKPGEHRRLLSLSGSSRAQYWHVAWKEYASAPWLGTGAGTFQRRWLRDRPAPLPVLDAHSLYLETLAETGPVGLVLLGGALCVPILAALRARGDPLVAPALGGYVVFLVHAAQDWDWELPAVTLAALACAASLLILGEHAVRRPLSRRTRIGAVAVSGVIALAAIGAVAGNATLASARGSVDRDDIAPALRASRRAELLVAWSPEPWRLHGEALLANGDVDGALGDFRSALRKDELDWESWADLALVTRGAEQASALRRARRLNPLEPVQP